MERILFGDNQFFAVNHLSDEKSRAQAVRFKDDQAIINVLDTAIDSGIETFMCTTHDRIANICNHIRQNPARYANFQIYPCMPYAHKYANAVTELGIMGALKEYMPSSNLFGTLAKGGLAVVKKDFVSIMEILVDTEMKMFKGIRTDVIFIQNVVTDLILGLGMYDFFRAFHDYVKKKYNAEPGFITMNLPLMYQALEKVGIENPIICASINKIGFRMSGGIDLYERTLKENQMRAIAMQVFAAGAIPPKPALEYVCGLPNIESVLFGASSRSHIEQNRDLINKFWPDQTEVLI
ncbi:hypothetical protein HNV11_00750 [Spirosoma taeanense]|uniref:Methylenetetrahydrofolate reductase n=1 Tax=Spirosoma taeanense TaxID=2735870 RepID=A0A6M5Y4H5_9BACT|nr:hypothetical protein [Spirosoma taeanense]QJW88003.1 hypothetical protein HNV11_00750 [Spirosoma taeanense]